MSPSDIQNLVIGAVQGLGVGAVFVLVLFIGFCVVLGFSKFRHSGPKTLTVRSLEESLGQPARYLPPDAPRGPSDQLAGSRRVA